jgi:hypothetical protein
MKAPEAASRWSGTELDGVAGRVVGVAAGPDPAVAAFTVVAVEDVDAPVEPDVDEEDPSAGAEDEVVDPPVTWPAPPEFTPVVFPPCEQAAGTARASTRPSTVTMRRVIDGHHRARARCS